MKACAFLRWPRLRPLLRLLPSLLPVWLASACWTRQPADAELFVHGGKPLFLTGVNLGSVQLLPFKGNPYGYSEAELKAKLTTAFAEMQSVGANSYRLWLHLDGSRSPLFQPQGALLGLPDGLIADLQWMIGTAYRDYGLLTEITLWSHQVLAVRPGYEVASRDRVLHLINDAEATKAYVDLALRPLLQAMDEAVAGAPQQPVLAEHYSDAIAAWEVFDEPEATSKAMGLNSEYQFNMLSGGYAWHRDSLSYLRGQQRVSSFTDDGTSSQTPIHFEGWYFATDAQAFNKALYQNVLDRFPERWDFLKKAIVDSKTLSTVEIPWPHLLRFIADVSDAVHRFAPEAKVTVGTRSGRALAQLPVGAVDFYQIHQNAGQEKAQGQLTKPVVVDELEAGGTALADLSKDSYVQLYDRGYAGVWGPAYFVERAVREAHSGQPRLYLDQPEGWQTYKEALAGLPSRLRYPVRGSPEPKRIYAD